MCALSIELIWRILRESIGGAGGRGVVFHLIHQISLVKISEEIVPFRTVPEVVTFFSIKGIIGIVNN